MFHQVYLQVRTYYVRILPSGILARIPESGILDQINLALIPTCVPTESVNAAEFRGFRKMTPGRNRNRNGMHILDWIYVIDQRQCHSLYEPRSAIVPHPRPCRDESNKPRKAETKCICHVQHRGLERRKGDANLPCNFPGMAFIIWVELTTEKNQKEQGICFSVR